MSETMEGIELKSVHHQAAGFISCVKKEDPFSKW